MGVGSQNTFLTYDPHPIARLCCEFQLSKGKTVGGDALQRPKSASKIYLSMDTATCIGSFLVASYDRLHLYLLWELLQVFVRR